MSELGDVFGSDFEKDYQQKKEMREQKRRKIDKQDMMEACWAAVEGEGFEGAEPRFTFDAGEVQYDVLLMQAPENNMDNFIHQFGDNGKTLGMFHLDELFSCAFLGDMEKLIGKVEEGEHYIVVGDYQENESDGEVYYNINPVAGITPISQAKKYADEVDEKMQGSSIEEQKEEQTSDETEDDEDDMDLSMDDDGDGYADESDVLKVFKVASNKKEDVMRSVAGGDEDALDTLVALVDNNVDGEVDTEYVADTYEENVDSIDGRGEDEEDEMDLGLDEDDGEEDSDDDMLVDDENSTESSEETADEEPDGDGGVEDWF